MGRGNFSNGARNELISVCLLDFDMRPGQFSKRGLKEGETVSLWGEKVKESGICVRKVVK